MGETPQHRLLKELGVLWLKSRRCTIIATECYVHNSNAPAISIPPVLAGEKFHYYADVLGISKCYGHYDYGSDSVERIPPAHKYESWCVEVKVSRSDYKNGFIYTGCNRHYVLTPPQLLKPSDLPKHVGLLERDPSSEVLWKDSYSGLKVPALRVVKKASKLEVDDERNQLHINEIGSRATTSLISTLLDKHKQVTELA